MAYRKELPFLDERNRNDDLQFLAGLGFGSASPAGPRKVRRGHMFFRPSGPGPFFGFPGGGPALEAFQRTGITPRGVELSPEQVSFYRSVVPQGHASPPSSNTEAPVDVPAHEPAPQPQQQSGGGFGSGWAAPQSQPTPSWQQGGWGGFAGAQPAPQPTTGFGKAPSLGYAGFLSGVK